MNITVRTRSQNRLLYDRMRQFIPDNVKCVAHKSYNSWEDAVNFLHDAIDATSDMLLVLDEDAFITDWDSIIELCIFMKDAKYTHAGVPDGGALPHRKHSFLTINPFFALFDCDFIKPIKLKVERDEIDSTVYKSSMENLKPQWLDCYYEHDSIEPFSGLFYWLADIGKPLFLRADTLEDGISTEVKSFDNKSICLHTWYSRLYSIGKRERTRIDSVYRLAIEICLAKGNLNIRDIKNKTR